MKIPNEMKEKYDEISKLLIEYSEIYLDKEYEELCLHALEKLCRKRPSPLVSGRANGWAAGIVYAIGSNNFIFDKSQPIHMTSKELAEPFGVAASTASSKAALIKKALKIDYSRAEWCLPSMVGSNTMLWMVSVNGLPVDARMLPREMQEICYERGLIPYVPADKGSASQKES
ncbi:MAG TPA: hypothetical protein DCZ91_05900 [Lachnospiraceae bacterium]|nr:hypothetical protein [Lachnospiraceae bacterium]